MRNHFLVISALLTFIPCCDSMTWAAGGSEEYVQICHGAGTGKSAAFQTVPVKRTNQEELDLHLQQHKDRPGRCLRDFIPDKSRWFRGFTIKAYALDQPNTLFDSMGNSTPNPKPELEKFELSLDLSKTLWSSDELVDAYQLAQGTAKLSQLADDTEKFSLIDAESFRTKYLSGATSGRDILAFFARTQKGTAFKRFLSAWKFSTAQSERQFPRQDHDDYEGTYGFVFDPKKMIITADRALKAYEGLESYTKLHNVPSNLTWRAEKLSHPTQTLRELSGLPIMSQGLVALIPAIEFKTVDQFDFIQVGSTFLSNPLIEDSIETITVTWDFSDSLNTTKKRRDAMRAIALHKKLVDSDTEKKKPKILPEEEEKIPRFCVGDYIYLQFLRKPLGEDSRWSGKDIPEGLSLQRNGLFHGYFEKSGSNTFTVTVTVKEENGEESMISEERSMEVEECRRGAP